MEGFVLLNLTLPFYLLPEAFGGSLSFQLNGNIIMAPSEVPSLWLLTSPSRKIQS